MATVTAEKQTNVDDEIKNLENELNSRESTEPENVQLPLLVEIEEFIQKNPLLALGIAIALGVTVGYLIRNMKNSETFQKRVMDLVEGLTKTGNLDILSILMNSKK